MNSPNNERQNSQDISTFRVGFGGEIEKDYCVSRRQDDDQNITSRKMSLQCSLYYSADSSKKIRLLTLKNKEHAEIVKCALLTLCGLGSDRLLPGDPAFGMLLILVSICLMFIFNKSSD